MNLYILTKISFRKDTLGSGAIACYVEASKKAKHTSVETVVGNVGLSEGTYHNKSWKR